MCACVCWRWRKERKESRLLSGCPSQPSEGSRTLTVDRREEQAEQQKLQLRHRSYRCRHCMCVRNCGIPSKYKLISTPVYSPCSGAASHSHTKVYIYASNLPFQVIARTPSVTVIPASGTSRRSHSDLYQIREGASSLLPHPP